MLFEKTHSCCILNKIYKNDKGHTWTKKTKFIKKTYNTQNILKKIEVMFPFSYQTWNTQIQFYSDAYGMTNKVFGYNAYIKCLHF